MKKLDYVDVRLFDTTVYDVEEKTSDKTKEENLQVRPFSFDEKNIKLKKSRPEKDLKNIIDEFQPHIIAMSCNEITFPQGLELLKTVEDSNAIKLVGGVLATFAPEELLEHTCIDMVCLGEGEGALLDIIHRLAHEEDISDIRNIYMKREHRVIKNTLRAPVDINELPFPDYDIFDEARFYRPMAGRIWKLFPIETSRGCPYSCSFCNSPAQRKLYAQNGFKSYFRRKSIRRIEEELLYLKEKYNPEYIYFLSDTLLNMKKDEFEAFCSMYEKFSLPFWCQNRPEIITYERMKMLKEIGCHRMSIGVEHGNEEFRKTVLKKPSKNSNIIKAFEILDKVGIPVSINNIIGFPDETRQLAFDTINLNRKLSFDTSNAYAFTPFRGTELYELCRQKGYIEKEATLKCLTKGTALSMPQFSAQEINGLIKTFSLYAKMPENYMEKIKCAERNDEQGKQNFDELKEIYNKMFFQNQ
ncbi:MAG: radical SAM protein [Vulcanimicrobiota bacterium]